MAAGEVDCVVDRRRPDRGERRHGEQDRHVRPRASPAAHHGIPLYVVAPTSTVDLRPRRGAEIPIEERDGGGGHRRASPARNPAFDVTPAALIAAIVTEQGVHRAPYASRCLRVVGAREAARARGRLRDSARPLTRRPCRSRCCRSAAGRCSTGVSTAGEVDGARRDVRRHERALRARSSRSGRRTSPRDRIVHDDGTTTNDDTPRRDRRHRASCSSAAGIDDDLLVIAGDNLFDSTISPTSAASWREQGTRRALAVYDVGDLALARQYGVVELDERRARSSFFEEKPAPAPRAR